MDTTTLALVGGGGLLLLLLVVSAAFAMSKQQETPAPPPPPPSPPLEEEEGAYVGRDSRAVYPSMGETMSPMLTSRPVSVDWPISWFTATPSPQPQPPPRLPSPPVATSQPVAPPYDPWIWTDPYPPTQPYPPSYPRPVAPVAPPAGQTWFTPEEMWRYYGHRCNCPAPVQVNGGYTHLKAMTPARDQAVCCLPPERSGTAPLQQCTGFRKMAGVGWVRDPGVTSIPWPPLVYTSNAKCVGVTYASNDRRPSRGPRPKPSKSPKPKPSKGPKPKPNN